MLASWITLVSFRLVGFCVGRNIAPDGRSGQTSSSNPITLMTPRARSRSAIALLTILAVALTVAAAPRAAAAQRAAVPAADLVLRNGKVVTMDASRPQAQAVAITGDRITAVGSDARVQRYVGPKTRVIDLHGHLAIPGFNESHGHFSGLGESLTQLKQKSTRLNSSH